MEKIVIIGGGIAGLSCLNWLLDQGVSPLLLEGTAIGAPKMCGEFLAPATIGLLEHWEIGPIKKIKQVNFFNQQTNLFNLMFTNPAGAFSRSAAEIQLAKRALSKGGRIRENAFIDKITPGMENSPYTFYLPTGEEIIAKTAIFATGRFNQALPTKFPFYGIKLHFQHVLNPETLLMYSLKQAYFGIVPINKDTSNFACLIKKELIEKKGSCKQFFMELLRSHESLQQLTINDHIDQLNWFESKAPRFEYKQTPSWPNAYWIGDALANLQPAVGSGFAHSVSSAVLAAEFYLQNNPLGYLKKYKKIIKPKLKLGMVMHQLMLNPLLVSPGFKVLAKNPYILGQCLKKLEYI